VTCRSALDHDRSHGDPINAAEIKIVGGIELICKQWRFRGISEATAAEYFYETTELLPA
jgi:hypothetical protein